MRWGMIFVAAMVATAWTTPSASAQDLQTPLAVDRRVPNGLEATQFWQGSRPDLPWYVPLLDCAAFVDVANANSDMQTDLRFVDFLAAAGQRVSADRNLPAPQAAAIMRDRIARRHILVHFYYQGYPVDELCSGVLTAYREQYPR